MIRAEKACACSVQSKNPCGYRQDGEATVVSRPIRGHALFQLRGGRYAKSADLTNIGTNATA